MEVKRKCKKACVLMLTFALIFGNVLSVSAETKKVKKWTQKDYYATMQLTKKSGGKISNGKYVNSGKKNNIFTPGSWNHTSHSIYWKTKNKVYNMRVSGYFLFFMEKNRHHQPLTLTFTNYK